MGTAKEEAEARDRIEQEAIKRQADALKKADAEKSKNKMVADPSAGVGWPDDAVSPSTGPVTEIAGKLGVGPGADLALAQRLLDSGRRPADAPTSTPRGDGATARIGAALNRPATPAVER
ncbi:hypothetical protein [Kribbella italica]|uniref:Uncharacterized protein n=1 Tax=Kribbella italica TaxID=1540520 RepID=A0A7W9J3Q8_9ACTN|nr:hypothetical protein [Kribbella italica]MBB5835039.1 hypothetical protein [Kribbella italica]